MTKGVGSIRPTVNQVVGRYANPLPRTISRTGEWLLLDGTWRILKSTSRNGSGKIMPEKYPEAARSPRSRLSLSRLWFVNTP